MDAESLRRVCTGWCPGIKKSVDTAVEVLYQVNKMAYIRPYRPSDEEAVIHVFRETAHAGLKASSDPNVLHVGSFIWARPYIALNPEWCYVLDDGNGTAVGYILCAPDTPRFVERYKQDFMSVLRAQVKEDDGQSNAQLANLKKEASNPDNMMISDYPNLVKQYPAHLHIDILPSHQNQKWGAKLIETLLERLEKESVKGIHLGMAFDNDDAGRFYQRMGFKPFEEMNEGGKPGSKGGAVFVCRKIAESD